LQSSQSFQSFHALSVLASHDDRFSKADFVFDPRSRRPFLEQMSQLRLVYYPVSMPDVISARKIGHAPHDEWLQHAF
jgi:hypothetical protein